MNNGFDAVYDKNSRVLILGSFPSVASRSVGFYYGNKQNKFWKTLEWIFGEKIDDSIDCKKQFLLKHNIALFDIVKSSDLTGSSDLSLSKSKREVADISFLLFPHTKVEKIFCNGKTAYNIFNQNYTLDLPVIYLPSTSPTNVSFDKNKWLENLIFLKK